MLESKAAGYDIIAITAIQRTSWKSPG